MKKICVTGGCRGAGTTFIASSLALFLAEIVDGVAFVESPKVSNFKEEPRISDLLSLGDKSSKKRLNVQHNVNWIFREDSIRRGTQDEAGQILNGRYVIYDDPCDFRSFDLIICVVDSLPSKVIASVKSTGHLKEYFSGKTFWVLNRGNDEEKRAIEKYLGIKFDAVVPMESAESIYKAERFARPLAKSKFIREDVKISIKNIAEYIASLY